MSGTVNFRVQTFTAIPDLVEDRIRLDVCDEDGMTQSIFLTRRLADRFIPLLLERVESGARQDLARDFDLAMRQQNLRIERERNPVPDVKLGTDAQRWLCVTIHLSHGPEGLLWTLTDEAAHTALIPIPGDGARAVADIILMMYRNLEWPVDVFPEWLRDVGVETSPAPRSLN